MCRLGGAATVGVGNATGMGAGANGLVLPWEEATAFAIFATSFGSIGISTGAVLTALEARVLAGGAATGVGSGFGAFTGAFAMAFSGATLATGATTFNVGGGVGFLVDAFATSAGALLLSDLATTLDGLALAPTFAVVLLAALPTTAVLFFAPFFVAGFFVVIVELAARATFFATDFAGLPGLIALVLLAATDAPFLGVVGLAKGFLALLPDTPWRFFTAACVLFFFGVIPRPSGPPLYDNHEDVARRSLASRPHRDRAS